MMDFRYYLTCLWPGLPELWWRGRLSALPIAVGWGIALNTWLILRVFYPFWLNPFLLSAGFWLALCVWIAWTIKSFNELPELIAPRAASDHPDRYPEAHQAYLQQQWQLAEKLLLEILSIDPRDPPALLLLSGVYRHTGRMESALALVQETKRLEMADGWQIEIRAELNRIERDGNQENTENEVSDTMKTQPKNVSRQEAAADLTAA